MAAEIANRLGENQIVEVTDERGDRRGIGTVAGQPISQFGRRAPQQPLILGIGHVEDATPQGVTTGTREQVLEQPTEPHGDDLPACRVEHLLEATRGDVRHHSVEGLPVEVDNPDDLAQLTDARIDDGFPHGTLVELGVSDERILPSAKPTRGVCGKCGVDEAARHCAPNRCRRTDTHRSRRVVDGIGILGARRVGLQTTVRAQRRQILLVQLTEKVVDGVQHRRRVRLDRHSVACFELLEPQRGHDGDHRRARRLMTAHLETRRIGPDSVGVVDHRRRQPQHPLGNVVQGFAPPGDRITVGRIAGGRAEAGHGEHS